MGRSCKFEACEECSQKCLLVHHGNKDPSPIVSSFFKILLGDRFLTSLIIPPIFAQTIMFLVNQKIDLEDAKGNRWRVGVSLDRGYLVLNQGWEQFASDHSLEEGDFLIFNYLIGSHFVVQIYCRSGCEKLKFSKRSIGNMERTSSAEMSFDRQSSDDKSSTPAEVPSPMIDKSWDNEQESSSPVNSDSSVDTTHSEGNVPNDENMPLSVQETAPCDDTVAISKPMLPNDCTEVPFYMIERDFIDVEEANRSCLDLSDFEMAKGVSNIDREDKKPGIRENLRFPSLDAKSVPQNRQETYPAEKQCNIIKKESVETERASIAVPLNISNFRVPESRCHAQDRDVVQDKIPIDNCTSQQPDRRCDSMKKAPLLKDKISSNIGTSKRPQVTFTPECPQNETGNPEESSRAFKNYQLSEKLKSGLSGKDYVSQSLMKLDILGGCSGSVSKIRKEMPGCGNAPISNSKNYLSGKKLKILEQHEEKVEEKCGRKTTVVKMEVEDEVSPTTKVPGQASKMVKTEMLESTCLSPFNSANINSSAYAVTRSFLEFPANQPTLFCIGRMRMERKIVLIRDPAMRLWPVFYHEKFGFRVLVTGWKAIVEANNIQLGDQCRFEVENDIECIFRLHIIRK